MQEKIEQKTLKRPSILGVLILTSLVVIASAQNIQEKKPDQSKFIQDNFNCSREWLNDTNPEVKDFKNFVFSSALIMPENKTDFASASIYQQKNRFFLGLPKHVLDQFDGDTIVLKSPIFQGNLPINKLLFIMAKDSNPVMVNDLNNKLIKDYLYEYRFSVQEEKVIKQVITKHNLLPLVWDSSFKKNTEFKNKAIPSASMNFFASPNGRIVSGFIDIKDANGFINMYSENRENNRFEVGMSGSGVLKVINNNGSGKISNSLLGMISGMDTFGVGTSSLILVKSDTAESATLISKK